MNKTRSYSLLTFSLSLLACQSNETPRPSDDGAGGTWDCGGAVECTTGQQPESDSSDDDASTSTTDSDESSSDGARGEVGSQGSVSSGDAEAPSGTCGVDVGDQFQVCPTDESGPVGDSAVMLGMSIQEPDRTDMHGATIDESDAGPRWMGLPRSFFRFPAGTDSYTLASWDAPEVTYFLDTFRAKYPGVPNDQTWPPQLPVADFGNWVHDDLQRITLGNEPPTHADHFPTGDSYVAFAESIVDAYPDLSEHFWIQTGKPEVVRYNAAGPAGLARHEDLLETAAAAVAAGDLPARITTTHKLLDDYPGDRLDFYRELVEDYQSYFGDDVQLCFQEYKYKADEMLSHGSVLRIAEFLLVMSRLRFELGETISGGAYQQGFASGTANLIGLDDAATPEWTETGLTDLWDLFGESLSQGAYVQTESFNRPGDVQVELFEGGGRQYLLYVNTSDDDVALPLEFGPDGGDVERIDDDLALELDVYAGVLPAASTGRIRVR